MTLLQEILTWSQGLPTWQSDAVARLLAKDALTADDRDDLLALLKSTYGIADPKGRTPAPLTAAQVPVPAAPATQITLAAMRDLKNVNAIAENQRLAFGELGLTVIYGDNGSGKSGYSRVLKRACRARDQAESILPNANLPHGKVKPAEAIFELLVNHAPVDAVWADGTPGPSELSTIAIFDSRCARAYLDSEDDFSYVPYGLDIFDGLARLLRELKVAVEAEREQYSVDLTAFDPLRGDSQVGKLISTLSAKTLSSQVESLATISETELAEHAELNKSLKESNPKDKANQLRLCSRRMAAISGAAIQTSGFVSDAVITKLRSLVEQNNVAAAAAAVAAKQNLEGEKLLHGTGGPAWRQLFEAARRFAVESHPSRVFPDFGEDEACPLCQQPLGEGAKRLLRFEAYIQQEAEKTSQASRVALDAEYRLFMSQDLNLNLDEVTLVEIESLDAELASAAREFQVKLKKRQEAVRVAVAANSWDGIELIPEDLPTRVRKLADKLNSEAETLEKMADESERAVLQQRFDD